MRYVDPLLRSHSVRKGWSGILTALLQVVPGVIWIRAYRRQWLLSDLIAGITVAAVSLPIGMAMDNWRDCLPSPVSMRVFFR